MSSTLKRTFIAEAAKGYILKVLIDALAQPLPRTYMSLDKEGISICQPESGETTLFDISIPREDFRKYKCKAPKTISFNTKHMQKLLRNVKKKDSITLFIDNKNVGKIGITIRPESSRKTIRFETNYIVYQEEPDYTPCDLPDGGYKDPVVIDSSDFQKIKRLTTVGKIINVVMQDDNYLSFKCGTSDVYSSELGFGELKDDDDCSDDEDSSGNTIYESQFYSSVLNLLVKLPGLGTQMQIYRPLIDHYPLRIKVKGGQSGTSFGKYEVYCKDIPQITFEESLRSEAEIEVEEKPKKKKKKSSK